MIAMRRVCSNTTQLGIYLYREVYFLNFVIPPHVDSPRFDAQTSTFTLLHSATPYCYVQFLRLLESLMARFSRPAFLKIRFRGKGYYMYKTRRNTIAPNFGYAHRVYVYAPALSVLFLSKTKILLFGLSPKEIISAGHRVKATKPINIFTGRGVRFARQTVYKKTGKVSSYR